MFSLACKVKILGKKMPKKWDIEVYVILFMCLRILKCLFIIWKSIIFFSNLLKWLELLIYIIADFVT